MTTRIRKYFIALLQIPLLFLLACNGKDPVVGPGQEPTPGPDPEPTKPERMDFSRLTEDNHPRLLMTDADETRLKNALAAGDPNVKAFHTIIKNAADKHIGGASLKYVLTGKRLNTARTAEERIMFCAYVYRMTGETKYLDQAKKDMLEVCSFPDWNAKKHFLDAAEMATGVAVGYDWLYSKLSTSERTKIRTALENFSIAPALNKVWNLNFYKAMNNWNQVCNGGLVCAALVVYENNVADCKKIIQDAIRTNSEAMKVMYSPDGNYPEGYSYWNFGTMYQCLLLTALESALTYDAGLSSISGFSKTGEWILAMEGTAGNMCFNYSDCPPNHLSCIPLWYFASKFSNPSLLCYEQADLQAGRYTQISEFRLLPLVAVYASRVKATDVRKPSFKVWSGQGPTPVVLVHGDWSRTSSDMFLGIKGGKAETSHGHMDAGSFVYDAWGTRWSADLGLQSYAETEAAIPTFWNMGQDSGRWTLLRYCNYNHSTLTINDSRHLVSGEAVIKDVVDSDSGRGATVDMTAAVADQCASAVRKILYSNEVLTVEDSVKPLPTKDAVVKWTMITMAVPEVGEGGIRLKGAEKTLLLKAESSIDVKYTQWGLKGESYDADNTGYYEVGFTATVPAGSDGLFKVTLAPVK